MFNVKCPRCRIRIASVKIGKVNPLTRAAYELSAFKAFEYAHVCSKCWKELNDITMVSFEIKGNWIPGAVVEYLKDTPSFLSFVISVAAIVVSITAIILS